MRCSRSCISEDEVRSLPPLVNYVGLFVFKLLAKALLRVLDSTLIIFIKAAQGVVLGTTSIRGATYIWEGAADRLDMLEAPHQTNVSSSQCSSAFLTSWFVP